MLKLLLLDEINDILKANDFKQFTESDIIYLGIPRSSIRGIFKNNILLYSTQYIHIGEEEVSITNYLYRLDVSKRKRKQIIKSNESELSIKDIINRLHKYIDKVSPSMV